MIKVALIGYGYWGKIIRKYIEENDGVILKRIYDRNHSDNILFTDNLDDIVNDPEIECVFICTPVHTHYYYCKLFLTNGKHVFCEKPLAILTKEVDELIEIARNSNKVLYTDYIYTLSEGINKVRNLRAEIGKLQAIEARIEQFGAFYKDEHVYEVVGVHLLSAIIYILECYDNEIEVKFIDLVTNNDGFCTVGKITMEIDDLSVNMHCDLLSTCKNRTIKLIGSHGIIQFDMMKQPTVELLKIQRDGHKYEQIEKMEWSFDEGNNLIYAINQFIHFVNNDRFDSNNRLASLVTKLLDRKVLLRTHRGVE
ncbi:Gfo/Idh/MocA family protein [Paenibacillus assamensis]|uniref:Gfo/Idh/MocA family protein n=1 Tax=Paenibacillus assamensis TaxID=311244 RepID=UPI000418A737|nr:Gfo/Idh/MocA family oxidoreductase [Paenibacillus assamensis]